MLKKTSLRARILSGFMVFIMLLTMCPQDMFAAATESGEMLSQAAENSDGTDPQTEGKSLTEPGESQNNISDQGTMPGNEPANVPDNEPDNKPADVPDNEPDNEPADVPDNEPADVPDDEPEDVPDDKPVQEQSYKDAYFSVVWSDQKDLAQRRPENIYDLIELYADGIQLKDTDFDVTLNKTEENQVYDFEILSYTISKLPVYQEDMETEINYTLRQDVTEPGNVLPGYDALDKSILEERYAAFYGQELTPEEVLDTLAEPDAEVKLQSGEEKYNAEKSFANYLPVYKASGSITWPEEVEEQNRPALQEYFEQLFSISLDGKNYELASVDSSADKEDANVWNFSVKNLFTTDEKGNAVQYKLIPKQLDGFTLDKEEATVAGDSADFNFTYAYAQQNLMPLLARESEVAEKTSKTRDIVWFDAEGKAENAHPGELTLSMTYTVDGKETEITFTWNEATKQYEYNWTDADRAALSLPEGYPALVLTDEGENSLYRTLSVENLPSKIKVQEPGEDGKPGTEEISVAWSDIQIKKVNFTATDKIHHYDVRNEDDGTVSLRPIREMIFYQDIRSGNDDWNTKIEYLKKYTEAAFELNVARDGNTEVSKYTWSQLENAIGEGNMEIDEDKLKLYLPVYSSNKEELIYSLSFNDTEELNNQLLEKDGYYYRIEYDNTIVPGHGTDIFQTYAGGTVILIKTGIKDYNAQKYWYDEYTAEEAEENRPDAVYRLYRYLDNGIGSYKTASQITVPDDKGKEVSEWKMPKMEGTDPAEAIHLKFEELPKYNSDGYEYIYFIRETLPGNAEYEKIYGTVDVDGTVTGDVLPKNYIAEPKKRIDNDTSIYNGGIITNRKTDPMTVTAKKEWKAARYQDELKNIEVELTLYARHKNIQDDDADENERNDWYEVKTVTLDGFSAMYNSQTVSEGVNKYDAKGHELEYMWVETGVRQKTADAGSTTYFKNGTPTTIDQIVKDVLKANGRPDAKDADSESDSFNYRLPINLDSIEKDSCEHSDEYFVSTIQRNGNTTIITNELKGVTDYYVKKIWKDMDPSDITVDLIQTDKADNHTNMGSYTIKADGKDTYTQDEDGNWTTNWINAFPNLPLYDENGNLYTYKVVEHGGKGYYSYGYDVDGDNIIEENSTQIVNTPPPEGEKNISLRKVWLDDSVETGRGTVYAAIYTEDMTLLYGTLNQDGKEVTGVLSPDFAEISEGGNWRKEVNVAVYTKDGKYSAEQEDETWKLYDGDYRVTEVKIGQNEVSDSETAGGYHTVTNNGTTYAVMYYNGKNGETVTYNTDYAATPDENGDYVITNLRIGTVDLKVNKRWVDNLKFADRPKEVYFKLNCEEYKEAVFDKEDNKGYVKIPNALTEEQKILNEDGEQVASRQRLQSAEKEGEEYQKKEETIYFYNLPRYDALGKIIHYQVTEEITGDKNDYSGSSQGVVYDTSDSGSGHVNGSETITNAPSKTEDVKFHLLWLDEYRDENTLRPDIYLTLYYTKWTTNEDGTVTSEVVPYDFKEYLWTDDSISDKEKDFWTYTFYNMPQYDANGNPITYYASLATHADRKILDYIDVQYAQGDEVNSLEAFQKDGVNHSTVGKNENGEYVVNHNLDSDIIAATPEGSDRPYSMKEDNTFVLQLKEDVTIIGEKIWVKLPDGFPVEQLPKLTFKLYQNGTYSVPNEDGELIAAIVGYQSPGTRYEFVMKHRGINDIDGNLIDKDTVITVGQEEKTALQCWQEMLSAESEEEKKAAEEEYGKPLPKYDENGAMYMYEVIETMAEDKDGHIDTAYENLNGSVSGYNITNTYDTTTKNTRPIELIKDWEEKDDNTDASDVDGEFVYPKTTYTLYRFYMNTVIGEDGKTYANPEAVAQVELTAAQAKAGEKVNFGEQYIYAPNGKPYIYYVQEASVEGYAAPTLKLENVTSVETAEGFPENVGKDWFTQAFTLEQTDSDTSEAAVLVSDTNTYTSGQEIDITGKKVWNDYSDAFGIRPTTLKLTLSRQAEGIAKHEMAEITLDIVEGVDKEQKVTLNPGITNLHGDVIYTVTSDGNAWKYTIKGLDAYASNGKAWKYSVKETVPDNYKAQPGEVSGASVGNTGLNDLVNNNYTSLTVKKGWAGLNTGIHMPDVEVKLQVQYENTWYWADEFFTDESHKVEYSPVTKILNNGNGWTAKFNDLPEGYMNGSTYTKFVYRVMETKIGSTDVKFNGTEYATDGVMVNGTFYEIGTTNNDGNTISTVTNTPEGKTKLTVTKKWEEDSDNAYGTRGDEDTDNATTWSVNYYIYRTYTNGIDEKVTEQVMKPDGNTKYVLTVSGTNADTEKSAELDNLPASTPDGKEYTYYAVEIDPATGNEIGTEDPNGIYNGSYEVTGNGSSTETNDNFATTVTNKLITVDLKVTKTWEDSDFEKRPDKLTFRLYQKVGTNGAETDITDKYTANKTMTGTGDTWTLTYTKLPKYNPEHVEYVYRVAESRQDGYEDPAHGDTVTKDGNDNLLDEQTEGITNTITEFTIDKVNTDNPSTSLNNVTLVFTSTEKINNNYYQLTWTRDADGKESYDIKRGTAANSCTEAWSDGKAASGTSVAIKGLPVGTYKLTSETAPYGYTNKAVGSTFTMNGNGTITAGSNMLSVTNNNLQLQVKNEKTTFSINKVDQNGKEITSGWGFAVTGKFRASDAALTNEKTLYIGEIPTDVSNGILLADGDLAAGETYTLKEVVTPDYYVPSTKEVQFSVNANGSITITNADEVAGVASVNPANSSTIQFKNVPFDIQLMKKDSEGNKNLGGAVFKLQKKGTDADSWIDVTGIPGITTGANGSITLNSITYKLEIGATYRLEETKAPDGYILPDTAPYAQFTVAQDGTIKDTSSSGDIIFDTVIKKDITVKDAPMSIQVVKYDGEYDGSGTDTLGGVEFTLQEKNAQGADVGAPQTAATDADGILTFGPEATANSFKVVGGKTYLMTEHKTGYYAISVKVTVNTNGTIEFTDIEGNTYTTSENGKVVIGSNQTSLTVTNVRKKGSVQLIKKDGDDDKLLDNIQFTLYRKKTDGSWFDKIIDFITGNQYKVSDTFDWDGAASGNAYDSVEKSDTGKLLITGLEWGDYKLVETAADGYVLSGDENARTYEFTVDAANVDSLLPLKVGTDGFVTNYQNRLTIQKIGSENEGVLAGAAFELYRVKDGEETLYASSPEAGVGTWELKKLPVGDYKLKETVSPDGYALPDGEKAVLRFKVKTDGTIEKISGSEYYEITIGQADDHGVCQNTIKMKDQKIKAQILKADENGNGYLEGAEFTVKPKTADDRFTSEADSITINKDNYTTVLDGELVCGKNYIITETIAPNGYTLPETTFTLAVDANGKISVTADEPAKLNGAAISAVENPANTWVIKVTDKPISIKLVKLDGGDGCDDGGILANVEFTLTDKDGKEQKAVTDSDGKLIFGNKAGDSSFFVIGGQTYTLTETKTTGYYNLGSVEVKVGTDGMITLSNGESSFISEDGSVITVENEDAEVTNKRIPGSVTLTKIDSENEDALNGITFTLYKKNEGGWFDKFIDFITGNSYTLTTEFKWGDTTAADSGVQAETAENGTLTISGLDWGDYKLVETAADGYILSGDKADRTYEFTIDAEQAEKGTYLLAGNGIIKNDPNHLAVWKVDKEDHSRRLTGAVYELYYTLDSNGKEVNELVDVQHWNWDSETGVGTANRLRPGTYTLVETQSPDGYKIAPDLVFVMDEQGIVTSDGKPFENQLIYAEDEKTRFSFNKIGLINESCADTTLGNRVPDPEETKLLAGAEFTAYRDEALTEPVMTAESDRDGVVTFIGLPLGSYYIKETKAPSGYVLDDKVYTVNITSKDDAVLMYDGQKVADNTLVNDVYRADISFTKVSELNKAQIIPGGVYGLYKDGVLIAKCTSDEKGLVTFEGVLMDETYTVRELSVPGGSYVSSNEVKFTFTVDKNGNPVLSALDDGKGTLERTEQGLLWLEPQTVVEILKTDDKGKALAGATLRILDNKGNVVEIANEKGEKFTTWVTTNEALVITGCLEAGQTYYLEEMKAPEGYKMAKRIKFTLEDSAEPNAKKVVSIKMVDERIIQGVKTGDMQNPLMYLMTLAASAMMWLGFLIFGRRRKENMR